MQIDKDQKITVSWLTINWARKQFQAWVEDVYDDPIGYGFTDMVEVIAWQEQAAALAVELGVDLDALVAQFVSAFEARRMKQMSELGYWDTK